MALRLMIPNTIPSVDREQILQRVRREQRDLEDVMANARTSAIAPLSGWRWMIKRMRSLNALERAWMGVQL